MPELVPAGINLAGQLDRRPRRKPYGALVVPRLQMVVVYLQVAVAKPSHEEWQNGMSCDIREQPRVRPRTLARHSGRPRHLRLARCGDLAIALMTGLCSFAMAISAGIVVLRRPLGSTIRASAPGQGRTRRCPGARTGTGAHTPGSAAIAIVGCGGNRLSAPAPIGVGEVLGGVNVVLADHRAEAVLRAAEDHHLDGRSSRRHRLSSHLPTRGVDSGLGQRVMKGECSVSSSLRSDRRMRNRTRRRGDAGTDTDPPATVRYAWLRTSLKVRSHAYLVEG